MTQLHATVLSETECLVSGPEVLQEWRDEHRVVTPGCEFTSAYRRGQWDGYAYPGRWCRVNGFGRYEMRCSRGLIGKLREDFTVPLVDERQARANQYAQLTPTEHIIAWLEGHEGYAMFRQYQRQAVYASLTECWGRVALATNAGKGAVIALMLQYAQAVGVPATVMCDELAVFEALQEQIEQWAHISPALVCQGVKLPPDAPVTVAMIPTLSRRIGGQKDKKNKNKRKPLTAENKQWRRWLSSRGMVLLDEADKATAESWRTILTVAKGSHWRVGFSGTFPDPETEPWEDLMMHKLMGPVLVEAKNIEMVNQGVSAIPKVELCKFDATTAQPNKDEHFWDLSAPQRRTRVYELSIVENRERHAYIASLLRPNVPTAIIVNRIAHGRALEIALPAVFIDGSCSPAERKRELDCFQRGEITVLIVSKILDRGTNRLGTAADLLFVSGEGSTRQTLQRIGRGLRRADGKEYLRLVDVIDHVEIGNGYSAYHKAAARFVHTAARKRIKLYQDEGFDVVVRT